jgi:hypothetical protein
MAEGLDDADHLRRCLQWKYGRVLTEVEMRREFAKPIDARGEDSALLYAVSAPRIHVVRKMLELKANPMQHNRRGETPLFFAVAHSGYRTQAEREDALELVRAICGAQPKRVYRYLPSALWEPLREAFRRGHVEILEFFFTECGAPVLEWAADPIVMRNMGVEPLVSQLKRGVDTCRTVCAILLHRRLRIFKGSRDVAKMVAHMVWESKRAREWRGVPKL